MPTKDELLHHFTMFDVDGNGSISFDEFVGILTRGGPNAMSRAEAMSLFNQFDLDGSGGLDVNEFCTLMTSKQAVATHAAGVCDCGDKDEAVAVSLAAEIAVLKGAELPPLYTTPMSASAASKQTLE